MANLPKSGGACRGVIKPPNEAGPGGNRASNGYLPLGGTPGPVLRPRHGGDGRKGCVPLDGTASPVRVPGRRFDVDKAKMPQPPSAIAPGKGAIPVIPWDASGRPIRAVGELDAERPPRR